MSCKALQGVRILDVSRVLAGPFCTQILADFGADVIKIEKPGMGDDTRKWGPPFVAGTEESAYYLAANRNKRSLAVDFSQPEGRDIILKLIPYCDILVENFKVNDLARYGLSYAQLKDRFPRLIYCSITGFGQTGPYAARAGYDFLAQGMGGLMSLTGAPDGEPVKVGVANADLAAGMYAATAILAALRHRDHSSQGQYIDLSLLDCQLAWLSYEAENTLLSNEAPKRRGNSHPNIVPYQTFQAADGYIILAIGNDRQFSRFCEFAEISEIAADSNFATNQARVFNREILTPYIAGIIRGKSRAYWIEGLEPLGVPCGPVNSLKEALAHPQIVARERVKKVVHSSGVEIPLLMNPVKMTKTPPIYEKSPPFLGEHSREILEQILEFKEEDIARLYEGGVIG